MKVITAGLPNISGTVNNAAFYNSSANGAFTLIGGNGSGGAENTGSKHGWIFEASKSNSIYGKSDTVQQAAICVIPQFKF